MKFLSERVWVAVLVVGSGFVGCSKKATQTPLPAVGQASVPERTPKESPPVSAAPAPMGNAQQVNANWDAVSKNIANQDYDNAVRMWVQMDQAQKQAQMSGALRQEYARRAYQMQESLRQKAETDAKAREAYRALGRIMMGR
jgi:hypothetical protein